MPWSEVSVVDQRQEFVRLAMQEGVNRRELCRRFGVSPDVGYKWLGRSACNGELADRSRRPHTSPKRTEGPMEDRIVAVREENPAWGARKIRRYLVDRGETRAPAVSTVHEVLRRHGRIVVPPGGPVRAFQRFEKPEPNLLWQMDFKGWVRLGNGAQCHPLTVVDDHSRYAICIAACANQQRRTVTAALEPAFRRYGLPDAMFVDNGNPWGDPSGERWTRFGVWLLKLGVAVLHSRPYHPQSRGKNERFHRTLKAEVLNIKKLGDFAAAQQAFDKWRVIYNLERPHQALDLEVPASRYRPSPRAMPDRVPEVEYDEQETVRKVSTTKHYISFKGRHWKVPKAFAGERVAIRPLSANGRFGIFFGSHRVAGLDLTCPEGVSDVSEQVSAMSPD